MDLKVIEKAGIVMLAVGTLFSCASVPSFNPSAPIQESRSLQEGLMVCNEYHPPYPMKRPVVLRPFRDCVDEVLSVHPQITPHSAAVIFRNELDSNYGSLREQGWTAELGYEMELAIHALLRSLWSAGAAPKNATLQSQFTALEQDLALKHFPKTSRAVRAGHWQVNSNAAFDPDIEKLRAGFSALFLKGDPAASSLTPEQGQRVADLCGRGEKLKVRIEYLAAFSRDLRDILQLKPGSETALNLQSRYHRGLEGAGVELENLRNAVEEFKRLSGLRSLSCRGI